MDDTKTIRHLTDEEVAILQSNKLRLSIMDAQLDEALFSGMLVGTQDNEKALAIQQRLQDIQAAKEMLDHKLALIERNHGRKTKPIANEH